MSVHHRMVAAIAVLVGLLGLTAACSEDKSKGDPKKAGAAGVTAGRPAKELFAGPKAQLPAPLAGVKLRGPVEEAKKSAPWLFGKPGAFAAVEGYEGVRAAADLTDDGAYVRGVRVELPVKLEEARGFLEVAWGVPREAKSKLGDPKYVWTNTDSRLRASIEWTGKGGTSLSFEPVISVEQFLGTEAGRFGFETTPILGAAHADVKTAYAAWISSAEKPEKISILLPPFAGGEHPGWVFVNFKDGKAEKMTVQLSFIGDDLGRQALVNGLEQRFGKPKQGDMYTDYPGPPKVKTDTSDPKQFVIWIGG